MVIYKNEKYINNWIYKIIESYKYDKDKCHTRAKGANKDYNSQWQPT